MGAVVVPDSVAVMAVDPGKVTGVAGGLYNLKRANSTEAVLKRAVKKRAMNVLQIEGEPWNQAWDLYRMWQHFSVVANMEKGVAIPDIHLVFESFQLRQKDAELWPVEVTYGFLAIARGEGGGFPSFSSRFDQRFHFQTPGQAKGYATDARLRKWGVWEVGKEHGRDAVKHVALAVSRALDGELTDPVRS